MDLHSTVRFRGESLILAPKTLLICIRIDGEAMIVKGECCMEVDSEE